MRDSRKAETHGFHNSLEQRNAFDNLAILFLV